MFHGKHLVINIDDDLSELEVATIEYAIANHVQAAAVLAMEIGRKQKMAMPAQVGEFCTQLRRQVQHLPPDDYKRKAVLQLASSTRAWKSPGIPASDFLAPKVVARNNVTQKDEVIVDQNRINRLAGLPAAPEPDAETTARLGIMAMQNNLREADLFLIEASRQAERSAALVAEIHEVASKAHDDFADAA